MRAKFGCILDANVTDENCELRWWRDNCPTLPAWSKAARIAFVHPDVHAPLPQPRARRFSLVEAMFGTEQLSLLADQVQAGTMVRYNKRTVG